MNVFNSSIAGREFKSVLVYVGMLLIALTVVWCSHAPQTTREESDEPWTPIIVTTDTTVDESEDNQPWDETVVAEEDDTEDATEVESDSVAEPEDDTTAMPRVLPEQEGEFDPSEFEDEQIEELLEYIDALLTEAEAVDE